MNRALCFGVVAAISWWIVGESPAGQPTPPKADVDKARVDVKKAYADEYKRAVANPKPLVDKLADAADKEPRPADKCALLLEAEDWAVRGGDYSRAIELIGRRTQVFDCESVTECVALLQKVSRDQKVLQDADRLRDLFRHAMRVADQALDKDLIEEASSAADTARKFARSLSAVGRKKTLPGLIDEGNGRQGEATDLQKRIEMRNKRKAEYLKARDILARSSDDPSANWIVGRYLCFVLDRRSEGLPLLAKSGHEEVVGLAAREIEVMKAEEPDAVKTCELADAWWAVTEDPRPPEAIKEASADIRWHAARLYDLILNRLENPRLVQLARQRIDQVAVAGREAKWRQNYFKFHRLVATKQHASGWQTLYREIEFVDADNGQRLQGGKASASVPKDDPKQAEASATMAFDGSEQTSHDTGPRPAESGHWIQYEMPFPVKVGAVRILQSGGGNHVFDVEFQGSNDGVSWTTIERFKDLPDDFRTESYKAPVPRP